MHIKLQPLRVLSLEFLVLGLGCQRPPHVQEILDLMLIKRACRLAGSSLKHV